MFSNIFVLGMMSNTVDGNTPGHRIKDRGCTYL